MSNYQTKYVLASNDEYVFCFDHFNQLFCFFCLYSNVVDFGPNVRIIRFVNGVQSVHPLMFCVTKRLKPLTFQVRYYKSSNGYVMYVGYYRACDLRARCLSLLCNANNR